MPSNTEIEARRIDVEARRDALWTAERLVTVETPTADILKRAEAFYAFLKGIPPGDVVNFDESLIDCSGKG